jgi:hypothetical protein
MIYKKCCIGGIYINLKNIDLNLVCAYLTHDSTLITHHHILNLLVSYVRMFSQGY